MKLPYNAEYAWQIISGFDSIIFLIYRDDKKNEIWCLETSSRQWFKSHVYFPLELMYCDVVKVDDNCIYVMNYGNINVRINLRDMIPTEVIQFYGKYYLPLIYGYVRIEFECKGNGELHVSQDLKHLICKYFNAFL